MPEYTQTLVRMRQPQARRTHAFVYEPVQPPEFTIPSASLMATRVTTAVMTLPSRTVMETSKKRPTGVGGAERSEQHAVVEAGKAELEQVVIGHDFPPA